MKTENYGRLAHILLVDDNPHDAHLIEMALARASTAHTLTVATAHEEALRILRDLSPSPDTRPDIILLGLNSPQGMGLEILAQIKRIEHLHSVPVIALTSSLAVIKHMMFGNVLASPCTAIWFSAQGTLALESLCQMRYACTSFYCCSGTYGKLGTL